MNEFEYILKPMCYSFSSADTYENCAYQFRQIYIDGKPRENNFFGEYGTFLHDILHSYFERKLDEMDLPFYFEENYPEAVESFPPPYPPNMGETYFREGLDFLENLEFDRDAYEVVCIEESLYATYKGIHLVVKPDMILKEKATGRYILVDYKTKKLSGKPKQDEKVVEEYKKQLYLYAHFIGEIKQIAIDTIWVWFLRNQKIVEIPFDQKITNEVLFWFENTIGRIAHEEEWKPNLEKSNKYFCANLCGVRNHCSYQHTTE